MIITQKETRNFSIKSKDKNKIHLNKKYSSNFFFKDPIVHGINVLIKATTSASFYQTSGTITINRTPDIPVHFFFRYLMTPH